MAQPTGNLPDWDTNGTNSVEPSAGKKSDGWATNEIPPSSYFNWWMAKVGEWIAYLKTTIFADAHTWSAAQTVITPTTDYHASTKKYVDDILGRTNTWTAANTIIAPTSAMHQATKKSVDQAQPHRNIVINGGFDIAQLGPVTTTVNANSTVRARHTLDRWGVAVTRTSGTGAMTVVASKENNADHDLGVRSPHVGIFNISSVPSGPWVFHITQEIDREFVKSVRGKHLALKFAFGSINGYNGYGLVSRVVITTGTGAETETTYAGYTGTHTVHSVDVTGVAGALFHSEVTAAGSTGRVPYDATCMAIRFYFDSTLCGHDLTGATFGLTDVMLVAVEDGTSALPTSEFSRAGIDWDGEFRLCQRYFEKSYDVGVVPGTGSAGGNLWTIAIDAVEISQYALWPLGSYVKYQTRKWKAAQTIRLWDDTTEGKWYIGGASRLSSANFVDTSGFAVQSEESGVTSFGAGLSGGQWTADAEI